MAGAAIKAPPLKAVPGHPDPRAGCDGGEQALRRLGQDERGARLSRQAGRGLARNARSPRWASCSRNTAGCRVFLDACVHCGACTDKCHYFLGTGDPKNMPVARQDLLRKVYRRYFTLAGKWFPKLVGAEDLTKEVLEDWFKYFNQCSECRRCSVFCPYGIDTAEITMAAREIMNSVGMGQKYTNEIIGKVHKIGNNLGLPPRALADTLETHGGGDQGRDRARHQAAARPEGRRGAAGHALGRLLRRAARVQPDRLRQGVPRRGHQLDAFVARLRGGELRRVHRQLRADEEGLHARARGGARAGREAPGGGRVRPRLARRLQLLEHAHRPVRFSRPALPGAAAHLRADLRPDPARRDPARRKRTTSAW